MSRIDARGALYHIIARGIERKAVFQDDREIEGHFPYFYEEFARSGR